MNAIRLAQLILYSRIFWDETELLLAMKHRPSETATSDVFKESKYRKNLSGFLNYASSKKSTQLVVKSAIQPLEFRLGKKTSTIK